MYKNANMLTMYEKRLSVIIVTLKTMALESEIALDCVTAFEAYY